MNRITFSLAKRIALRRLRNQSDGQTCSCRRIPSSRNNDTFVLLEPIKVHLFCLCTGKRLMHVKFSHWQERKQKAGPVISWGSSHVHIIDQKRGIAHVRMWRTIVPSYKNKKTLNGVRTIYSSRKYLAALKVLALTHLTCSIIALSETQFNLAWTSK